MMNGVLLSQILELHYRKYISYCVDAQTGGCIDFMRSLNHYLDTYNQKNYLLGELQGMEINGNYVDCTHMFVKYDGLIFDSVRFGQKDEEKMKSDFAELNEFYGFKTIYVNKNYYEKNDENSVIFNNIKKEIDKYGFEFLKECYTIENDYKHFDDNYQKNNDLNYNYFKRKLNFKQVDYIYKNKICQKLLKVSENFNSDSKIEIKNIVSHLKKQFGISFLNKSV
jgi:hypothetical protein